MRRTSLGGLGISTAGLLSNPAAFESEPANAGPLWESFVKPPGDSRIMMRWWWFGPAVTHEELGREMRTMKGAGIGGVEVQPVYPLALDDPARGIRNLAYLSDEFLGALRFAAQTAAELGLRLDLTLGSGWPYGGAKVLATEAAGMLRVDRVPVLAGDDSVAVPALEAGEAVVGAWAVRDDREVLSGENIRELGGVRGPRVNVAAPDGARTVWFFIASRTGMQVKRPALGAEGFVIDHYSRGALEAYLESTGGRLMQAFASKKPYAVFSDSLEVFKANWTGDLLAEFERRRGYDLKPHLPALAGDAGPDSPAIRADWGRTLTELANENYLVPLREWAHRHGTLLRSQNYGEPPAVLSSNRLVDLPEGENPGWRTFSPARWASSASHLYGKPVTSAETWTWVHSPAFRATPLDLKAEADRHFLQGVNQIVGHGWPYSPLAAGEPGWRFYAAGALNAHNPWWGVMPDLALYLARVSLLLRQGKPANDVALYLSNGDAWARFTTRHNPSVSETLASLLSPATVENILDAGFNFDFIDDEAIERVGVPYGAVVLPAVQRIPLAAYQKLHDYARRSGALIAVRRKPGLAPGWLEGKRDNSPVEALTRGLFEGPNARGVFVGEESGLPAALAAKLTPDVATSPAIPELGFIHRKLDGEEIYFLANTQNRPHAAEATFRVKGLSPERWDPFTGKKSAVEWNAAADGRVTVSLRFSPYESAILVFSQAGSPSAPRPSGSEPLPAHIDISRDWQLSFPELGKTLRMERLRSWTEIAGLRFFSGRGVYEKSVSVPPSMLGGGGKVFLNFGEGSPAESAGGREHGFRALVDAPVREAAVVEVNGRRAGSVWYPPYEIDVTEWLRPGENDLRIEVANLAINRMAGKSLPSYRLLYDRYGERATPQDLNDLEPLASGLLGPITLVARSL